MAELNTELLRTAALLEIRSDQVRLPFSGPLRELLPGFGADLAEPEVAILVEGIVGRTLTRTGTFGLVLPNVATCRSALRRWALAQQAQAKIDFDNLPGWDAMSVADREAATAHCMFRDWVGVESAIAQFGCRYVDSELLKALSVEDACAHAAKVVEQQPVQNGDLS